MQSEQNPRATSTGISLSKEELQTAFNELLTSVQVMRDLLFEAVSNLSNLRIRAEMYRNLIGTPLSDYSLIAMKETRLGTSGRADTKATRPKKRRRSSTSGGAKRKARRPARGSRRSTRPAARDAHTRARSRRRFNWAGYSPLTLYKDPSLEVKTVEVDTARPKIQRYKKGFMRKAIRAALAPE
jgi:hypothetical protein